MAKSTKLNNNTDVSIEMTIPLLSTDLSYDGLQISATSNTYLGLAFSITNDFNNGTIGSFEFPTNPNDVSGYVDLRLAGPEDKDLPLYVPQDPVTTSVPSETDEIGRAHV